MNPSASRVAIASPLRSSEPQSLQSFTLVNPLAAEKMCTMLLPRSAIATSNCPLEQLCDRPG